jgi:DNA topoisomerase-1
MKKKVSSGDQLRLYKKTGDKDTDSMNSHKFTRQPGNVDAVKKKIDMWNKKIRNLEATISGKEETKDIALGTSKLNYNDPRITVEWCKMNEVPIERVFAAAVRDKFPWAMETSTQFKW